MKVLSEFYFAIVMDRAFKVCFIRFLFEILNLRHP